ncbi:double-cubane-cluster-containing anaerobic reductase [Syntrophus aciditrophicus]|uniref:Benzoyl-CoA reductase/2-hydroxyglutaryl-CoA dehydratase subunit, BcrC/BadD/HgdB n=1 Tax=Syntrophus aciditrophicus (strain SB) TaxID=56780 RepID=Q2LXI1_SYNAS|nr:double-cubane-cluster-containing anaerobic reductase [Syntrophus aciditrophicus]ABC78787.1 benzoyl-CoA reductase/2-hydroxyglutaryl-CoA dehydratase subunit, BcrC/BadD/HgdB [Syntrophus aciditrophicus SB]
MTFNVPDVKPLINDEFAGEAPKRALSYIANKRSAGMPVAGTYCGYAPMEVIRAVGAVPAVLCAFANKTIPAAEAVLPANLCPLIKSSYGFILTDTCPFFALSDAVVAETTCDGKKKMFELIFSHRPMFVMDLPQLPDEVEARANWATMISKLKGFLENTFGTFGTSEGIEAEIQATNIKNRLMRRVFGYAEKKPPLLSWSELYELCFLAQVATTEDLLPVFKEVFERLEEREAKGIYYGAPSSPRVLVTGCPVGGDSTKVFRIIEEAGGVVVAMDSCSGMKPFIADIEEKTGNPIDSVARHYLEIPCSCMTPNTRRLTELDKALAAFQPDAVVEVVLHACHSYNIEAIKIMNYLKEKHNLPYLKIVTDYSEGDVEQIRTRVEALLESI